MSQQATLYRMKTPDHLCPFGIKSKSLLKRKGYSVEDHPLTTRAATDTFKQKHNVDTTPQTFIDGERIGGYDDLRSYVGLASEKREGISYKPVLAIFITALITAYAVVVAPAVDFTFMNLLMTFVALTMVILAVQKLQDVPSFTNQFVTYDLLSRRWVPYAYLYPYAEAYVGIAMLASVPGLLVAPIALFIGVIGAVSVFKAVYIDKRELKCACVGGSSSVPLGFVSLTENLFMIAAGLWMLWH